MGTSLYDSIAKFCSSPFQQGGTITFCLAKPTDNKMRVIFSPPATILFVGDKKYVSKAHDEEFDEEKGLLMCLAKANGISHLKLKKLLASATRQNEKK